MSGAGRQPPWQYDNTLLKAFYYYNPNKNLIVLKDGQSNPKPPGFNPPTLGAARYDPERPNEYVTGSQKFDPNMEPRRPPDMENLSKTMSNLSFDRPAEGQIRITNQENGVQNLFQTEPARDITDPTLFSSSRRAESKLLETAGDTELLHAEYAKRKAPGKFFQVGRVFLVLWAEPAGENSRTAITALIPGHLHGRYGERVFSKVRRFVVIRSADNYCSALPVTTYGGKGVGKEGVNKSEHAIIFTGRYCPDPQPQEHPTREDYGRGMRPVPIHVLTDRPDDKLDTMSRIHFGKVHTIEHNIKVKPFGLVNDKSMSALAGQFDSVWSRQMDEPQVIPTNTDPRTRMMIKTLLGKGVSLDRAKTMVAQQLKEEQAQFRKGKQAEAPQPQATPAVSAADQRKINLYNSYLQRGFTPEQARALLIKAVAGQSGEASKEKQSAATAAAQDEEDEEDDSNSDDSDEDDDAEDDEDEDDENPRTRG